MILVTGATGVVGRAVVGELLAAGVPVRAVSRNPAAAGLPEAVEVVAADLGEPDSLPAALSGVDKVFALSAAEHKSVHDRNLAVAAARAGAAHLVQLSSLAAEENPGNLLGRWHLDGERAAAAAGIPVTVVRPGGFMTNALSWARSIQDEDVVRAPLGEVVSAPVDPRDIAAVVATALLGTGHEGRVYAVTGPEALTARDQTRLLGEVLGRPLRFEEIPVAVAREQMLRRTPAVVVDAVLAARQQATAVRAVPRPTVARVTGRRPRTFRQWAADHVEAFRPVDASTAALPPR
ncbi:SDR family oxidoreductase [Amycolatopsis sp. lyj-23]|uniref:SDR family oxidoreductase n=1 Tax=Amycolatopsis sp. lyj-23 TaxID=2789283 RepID=UPI00397A325E